MDVYRSLSRIPFETNTFITSGALDGVHLGHRHIIQRLLEKARAANGRTAVITFEPHPSAVVGDGAPPELLTPLAEKLDLLSEMGLDAVLVVRFTRSTAGTAPQEFIRKVWVKSIGVRGCVIGYDHAFGKAKSGGLDLLRGLGMEHGFSVDIVDPVTVGGETVSSTRIRSLLREGRTNQANAMLGRPYGISGIVVRGDRLGATLGFPTANLEPEGKNKLIPADGVYAAYIEAGAVKKDGLVYIGKRPTVAGGKRRIEANLFDFMGELYGERITFRLIDRLRPDQKFDSVQALTEQMKRDREAAVIRLRPEKKKTAKNAER
jgi:riboflavin kinase / FMN adenylyltransferase